MNAWPSVAAGLGPSMPWHRVGLEDASFYVLPVILAYLSFSHASETEERLSMHEEFKRIKVKGIILRAG